MVGRNIFISHLGNFVPQDSKKALYRFLQSDSYTKRSKKQEEPLKEWAKDGEGKRGSD